MSTMTQMEQKIMDCWAVVEDMKVLYEALLDKDLSQERAANVLLGLQELYDLKFQNLFDNYTQLIKEKT